MQCSFILQYAPNKISKELGSQQSLLSQGVIMSQAVTLYQIVHVI